MKSHGVLVAISTGETHTISEWGRINGVHPDDIVQRLKEGRGTDVAVGNSVHSMAGNEDRSMNGRSDRMGFRPPLRGLGSYLDCGDRYPYDAGKAWHRQSREDDNLAAPPATDWAHRAARGVIAEMMDRKGIFECLEAVPHTVRAEMVRSIAAVIRAADRDRQSVQQEREA